MSETFNKIFSKWDKNYVDAYIEEQEIEQDKLDSMWLSVNWKQLENTLNESSHNAGFLKSQSDVKLPKLTLPTFSVNLEEWLSFYVLFRASVDCNESLTNCKKLQYLKLACKNSALKVFQCLPISDSNYKTALEPFEGAIFK